MRPVFAVVALLVTGHQAAAQDRDVSRAPAIWLSVSGGYAWLEPVADGTTSTDWLFGDGWPVRMSLEKALGGNASAGVSYSYLRAPLLFIASQGPCSRGCDAHATVSTYGALFRYARGRSFHDVWELGAGVIQYGDFEGDQSGDALPTRAANRDFAFSLGAGVGYSVRRDWALELMYVRMYAVHERTNLPGNVAAMRRHDHLRFGLRVGY
jgi:hypothetical protein